MKTRISFPAVILLSLLFTTHISYTQIEIIPIPEVTPDDMVEYLIGIGVYYDNVTYQGADQASGIFNNGSSTNIGIETGIFLTSGSGYIIPGPNTSASAGANNGLNGHPLLDNICTATTFDASVLEFDFLPLNDTVKCRFVFGSEEYSEWVGSSFNDVFGFFVTGPNPDSGYYNNQNIALIPGTEIPIAINYVNNGYAPAGVVPTGPCTNCEYFVDNTFGLTIEYDGFTTVITLWVLVIPDEAYHFAIAIGDAGDHIYDSGVLLEGTSFKSLGPPDFLSFNFLMEQNPELSFDITGEILGNEVYLEIPPDVDLTDLVADFEVRGVDVYVDDVIQEPGVTPNDFSEPLDYHLEGYANSDWTIHVVIVTDIVQQKLHTVVIGPNPSIGRINIKNVNRIEVKIYNLLGNVVFEQPAYFNDKSLIIDDLPQGIYFVELEKDGFAEIRKVIVN
ncbi:MAG: T9SS type A sorting domain-containing protein [Bacteroidales bacterium]|nr:T9SS type A sorting domain-containing protein [Bacteroidales bacterium]